MKRILTAAIAATIMTITGCGSSGGGGIGGSQLYIAEGSGKSGGYLYGLDINADPIEVHVVGQLKDADGLYYPVTGLVLHTDGNLYATTVDSENTPQGDLFVQIDRDTGEVTPISTSGDDHCLDSASDIDIAEDTIYGVSAYECFFSVTTDGEFTEIATVDDESDLDEGSFAYDPATETAYFASYGGISQDYGMFTVDLDDGSLDYLTDLDDPSDEDEYISEPYLKAMTVLDGRLLALVGTYEGHTVLVEIDPDDGSYEILGVVPTAADAMTRTAN